MSFSKIMGLGVLAIGLAFATTSCSLFEPDEPEGYQGPDNGAANGVDLNANGPNANLQGQGSTGPGEFGAPGQSVANPYGDFGTPIPGLHFEPVYFAYDQARIGTSELSKIQAVAEYIKQHPGTGVVIEGNCDERGSAEYNRALGERRAIASKEVLLKSGIADSCIRTISYGVEKPADPGHNESAWSKNRRDEFVGVTLNKK